MNQDEIVSIVATLNELQRVAFIRKLTAEEKGMWNLSALKLKMAGYGLKKFRFRDPSTCRITKVIWSAKPFSAPKQRNNQCEFVFTDVRPNGMTMSGNHRKGDCTTRALTYVLRGEMDYIEIEREQYRRADKKNRESGLYWGDFREKFHRNTDGVWDEIMIDRGYVWVCMTKKKSVANVASYFKDKIDYPMIAVSTNHATIIDKGVLHDTWDCRGSRIYKVLVKKEDYDKAKSILSMFGIDTKI